MREVPVRSRLIESIYFSSSDGQLHLRLHGGEIRKFNSVPEHEIHAMIRAASPGRYYMDNIRKDYPRIAA